VHVERNARRLAVPKEFSRTQKLNWVLTANGQTTSIPFHMHTDYNITPMKSSEESPNREFNTPPVLRFVEAGPKYAGPLGSLAAAIPKTAAVGVPMPIDIWTDDDALYSTGGNAPMSGERPPVEVAVTKYRGPGTVSFDKTMPAMDIKSPV
jgi:hypothetical protein